MKSEAIVHDDSDAAHPVDTHVGSRMRLRRVQCGLSQGALARRLGISFQAVQKYETGHIRISASRLYEVSKALEVSPEFFFLGYADSSAAGQEAAGEAATIEDGAYDPRAVMPLIRAFNGIRNRALRADILHLLRALRDRAPDNVDNAESVVVEPAARAEHDLHRMDSAAD